MFPQDPGNCRLIQIVAWRFSVRVIFRMMGFENGIFQFARSYGPYFGMPDNGCFVVDGTHLRPTLFQ